MTTDCNAAQRHNADESSSCHEKIAVILLSGLPASGKSTLARKLGGRFNRHDDEDNAARNRDGISSHRLIHIEYDHLEDNILLCAPEATIRTANDNEDEGMNDAEKQRRDAWNRARQKAVEQMERAIQSATKTGDYQSFSQLDGHSTPPSTVILMDDNFHLRGMRKQLHRLLLGYNIPIRFAILYFDTPLDICLERNRNRSGRRRVPDDVIVKMSSAMEPPRAAWEVDSTMTIVDCGIHSESLFESRFEEILKFIERCPTIVELPPDPEAAIDLEQQAADRTQTRESQIHSLDKLLRSFVGLVAKFDKTYAKAANLARKKIMEEYKTGRIEFATVDNCDGCVASAFLDFIVPIDTATTGAKVDDPSEHCKTTMRSQLRENLSRLTL